MTHIGVHVLEYDGGDSEDAMFGIALSMAYSMYVNIIFLISYA